MADGEPREPARDEDDDPTPTTRGPGPRDWEPTDPGSTWWNLRPGDPLGPSDQPPRQPWERQGPPNRYGGTYLGPDLPPSSAAAPARVARPLPPSPPPPPAPPPPGATVLRRIAGLTVIAVVVATVVAVFVPPHGVIFAWAVLVGGSVLLACLVGAALVSLHQAWPARRGTRRSRIGFWLVAVPAALVTPADFAMLWVPTERDPTPFAVDLGAPVLLAAVIGIAAAALGEHPEPQETPAT